MITSALMEPHRAQWKTQMGFLLAAIGSAVGLGNIWRFPYLCYENGGGAFLIPYLTALVTTGIPLMMLELGLGHRMRGSAPMAFARISPRWEWLGWWMVLFVMFGICLYYCVVIAWCVNFLALSLDLGWGGDPNAFFFKEFLGTTAGPHVLGDVRSPILVSLLIVWLINWGITFFGVQHGIEQANTVFMPLLVTLTALLVGWALTLPGAGEGIARYLTPDFAKLAQPQVWVAAFGQIFFTLSIGFGIMIAYASYLPRRTNLNTNATITCVADSCYSLLAGFAVFGTLGYMAHETGRPFEEVVTKGIGLAFVAYPQAISLLPKFASVFGMAFFLALIVAGISSSISILEAFTAAVVDKFHYPRRLVVSVLAVLGFVGGIVFTTQGGLYWVDIADHFLSQYGLFLACILQALVVGWLFGASKLRDYINEHSAWRNARAFSWAIRWLIPVVLVVLVVHGLALELRQPYGGYPWVAVILIGWGWLLATWVVSLFVAARPWRRALTRD
jgi:NSS family neurotransmitter:Na+ symporter